MNDDVKAAVERFHTWEFDGLDARDHAALLAHIDGEPARIAAACEEVREACAQRVPSIGQPHDCFEAVRATPLTATPLADALRLANETVVKLAQASTEAQASAAEGVRYWTDLAQAEARDAATLRARVAALEAAHTEALDALEKLCAAQKHVLEVRCAGDDEYMAACDGAESILAKAGRR